MSYLLSQIDKFLNNITMYRLVLYGTMLLAMFGIALSFAGVLPFGGLSMIVSLAVLMASALITNKIFGYIFRIPLNVESAYITALILFLILPPAETVSQALVLALAGAISMASKFIFNLKGKHIFNPAALAAFVITVSGLSAATWWVGSSVLLPIAIIVGLLIVRKLHRFDLLLTFLVTGLASIMVTGLSFGAAPLDMLKQSFTSWPLVFFGTVMLTEPLTMPPTRPWRILYGALTGLLFGSSFSIGPVHNSPEFTLLIGNIFSYLVSPKYRLILKLKERLELGPSVYEFVFTSNQRPDFAPGQYLEWTLRHSPIDSRGNRRYFSISSAPGEPDLRLGIKTYEPSSTYKKALLAMQPGDELLAGQLAGDFTLPDDPAKKIVGIAGGIGITPFRSMVKHLVNTKQQRDMVLYYVSANPAEFVYKDVLAAGEQVGVKTLYVLSGSKEVPAGWTGKTGYITAEMIKADVPDFQDRLYYLSGPPPMVDAYKKLLASLGIRRTSIHTDYFPGY